LSRALVLGLGLLAVPASPLRATGRRRTEPPPQCSEARSRAELRDVASWLATRAGSLRARVQQPIAKRPPTIDLMICQSARSLEQLQLLRNAWIDEALTVPGIKVRVFVPSAESVRLANTDHRLGVTALSDWHGDVSSFQVGMSNALVPCEHGAPAARFYAVMDDDMVVKPRELMNWALRQQSQADKESGGFGLWGHEGCCTYVYGGMMLMTQRLVQWILSNRDAVTAAVTDEMVHHVNHSLMGIYDGVPYNIDHFFSIAARHAGGLQAVHGTRIVQDRVWDKAELCPWPQGVLVMHHIDEPDFEDFVKRTARGGEGCGERWPRTEVPPSA